MLVASRHSRQLLVLSLDAPAATSSYHLEFHTPKELECILISLPEEVGQEKPTDSSHIPVAHTHGSFENEPSDDAVVILNVSPRGPFLGALLASLFCMVVVFLALVLPDAKLVGRSNSEGPATTLLTVPALIFSFLAARGESALVRRPLGILRFLIGSSAVTLFLVAASLVGELQDPWLDILWWALASWNFLVVVFLSSGHIRSLLNTTSSLIDAPVGGISSTEVA